MSEKEDVKKKEVKKPAAKGTKKPAAKKTAAKKPAAPKKTAKPKAKPKAAPKAAPKPAPEPKKTEAAAASNVPDAIIKKYMWWSMGTGLFPVPVLDMAAITAVQLKMLADLSNHYGVDFSGNMGRSLVASLLGSLTAVSLRRSFLTRMLKAIPIIGFTSAFSLSLYAGATTYAVGKVFSHHFEHGGSLLNFEAQKAKELFDRFFKEGKKTASIKS
jgi:uncharacterized protein (DUF697 family)